MKYYYKKEDYEYISLINPEFGDNTDMAHMIHFISIAKGDYEKCIKLRELVAKIVLDQWPGFKDMTIDEVSRVIGCKRNYDNELILSTYIQTIVNNVIRLNGELIGMHLNDMWWVQERTVYDRRRIYNI